MTLPGHSVTIGERVAASVAAPSTANGFMVGYAERGPIDAPVLTISLADAVSKLGERVSGNPYLYDSLDVAFREGASSIYVGRIVGKEAANAANELLDAESKKVLKVKALSPGAWGNSIKVAIVLAGSEFSVTVSFEGFPVESVSGLESLAEAIAWAQDSTYISLAEGEKGTLPKTQTVELKSGKDDNSNSANAPLETALALFSRDLGPGQVAAPGFVDEAVHEALLEHAAANNRRALLDDTDTEDENTLAADAIALRTLEGHGARYGGLFAPWAVVPGLSSGTTRTVPYSAVETGLIARAEAEGFTPNQAAAGKRGRARYATGLSQAFTDAQRETLNDAGVNVAILVRGVVTTYGNRTLTNPVSDGDWGSFSASRLVMGVAALGDRVLEDYDFEQIDGHGYVFKQLEGDLSGRACMPFYLANSLYGQTPEEAFAVNTGPDVNTPKTIAAEEIKAQIAIRVSPTGEMLSTEVVKVPIGESL